MEIIWPPLAPKIGKKNLVWCVVGGHLLSNLTFPYSVSNQKYTIIFYLSMNIVNCVILHYCLSLFKFTNKKNFK